MRSFLKFYTSFLFLFRLSGLFAGLVPFAAVPFNNTSDLGFRENKGQVCDQNYKPRPDILFSASDGKMLFHFRGNGISYQLSKTKVAAIVQNHQPGLRRQTPSPEATLIYRIDINWLNINNFSSIKKEKPVEAYDNFYSETCPDGALKVKSYGQITYQQLYPGIDLKWYNKTGNLKYDYLVEAGADYRQIRLEIKGAKKISIGKKGEVIIKTPLGDIVEQAPSVEQNGKSLPATWIIRDNVLSFDIRNIDPRFPFVIDPLVRFWGTYFGGSNVDESYYTSIDPNGDVFMSGITRSSALLTIATTGAYQTVYGGPGSGSVGVGDAFLAKFNPSGQRLWSTYYGGSGSDLANECDVDGVTGNVYMVGITTTTTSGVMASAGAHQTVFGGGSTLGDAFLVKFDGNGARLWGTYYGGSLNENGLGCCVDFNGNVFLCGGTGSPEALSIATPGSHQVNFAGWADGYIVKFNSIGVRQWGTYYGGAQFDDGYGCNVDASGNVYLTGSAGSINPGSIATPACHQFVYGGGGMYGDGFLAKFNPSGIRLWGTYYGGTGNDYLWNSEIDGSGFVYVTGMTWSATGISTPGSHQPAHGGVVDALLVKFDASGTRIWGTYYGGSGNEEYAYCDLDASGNILLAGSTTSSGGTIIATPCTYQDSRGGGTDVFLVKFDPSGLRIWGTYYGGTAAEFWATVTVDISGSIYLTGLTSSSTGNVIATSGSHQPGYGGGTDDGFLVKFDACIPASPPNTTSAPDLSICSGDSTVLTTSLTCGINWFNTAAGGSTLASGSSYSTQALTGNTTFYIEELSCGPGAPRTAVNVTIIALPLLTAVAVPSVICEAQSTTITASGAGNYAWLSDSPFLPAGNSIVSTPTATSIYTVSGSDGTCFGTSTVIVKVIPNPQIISVNSSQNVCRGSSITLRVSGADVYTWLPSNILSSNSGSVVAFTPTASIIFTVTGSNNQGTLSCSSQTTMSVGLLEYPNAFVSENTSICEGGNTILQAGGGNNFSWQPAAGISDPNHYAVLVSPVVSTLYSVTVSNGNGCGRVVSVMVKVHPKPLIDAGKDTIFNLKEPMLIEAVSNANITWIGGEDILCKDCPSTQVFPIRKTCYLAQATSEFGCIARDEVCIDVGVEYALYVPNTFSPNNDGTNDVFFVNGFGIYDINLVIYDRWGEKLFVSNDRNTGWDGKYNGEVCDMGVYVYSIEYSSAKGKRELKTGHVTIIKDKRP
ncbi:MAG: gliding motility-associated C-terminal domain-containing protein [Bacteroidota bacterium]